ncbi:MAG: hypothetical protein DVS81_02820 [Candidatus Accumulibacter meliphilus]|uniref:Uncharacterized protein n=1 Tax=Candidatus Accumulibacter meliphilus TaxID=2211374 RepID=A0A369XS01_9PROT|nr:MAG: hypothetical protein DVS81_02820 [Candidatus Accumulibacter meliphilus]
MTMSDIIVALSPPMAYGFTELGLLVSALSYGHGTWRSYRFSDCNGFEVTCLDTPVPVFLEAAITVCRHDHHGNVKIPADILRPAQGCNRFPSWRNLIYMELPL